MKYMPQDVFDTCVLVLAHNRFHGDEERYEHVKQGIMQSYKDAYADDTTYMLQADEMSHVALEMAASIVDKDEIPAFLAAVIDMLRDVDENLKPKRGMRKVFSGTFFTKGHPNPELRQAQAIKDFMTLFMDVRRAYQIKHAHDSLRT